MTYQTYEEFNAEVTRLYGEGQFGEVFDLLTSEGGQFPERAETTHYLRSCMAARLDRQDLAIELIRESFERGNWYGERLMRDSPSYAPLQGLQEFERLVEIGKAKQAEARGRVEMLVGEPEGAPGADRPWPAIIALHGNTQNAQIAFDAWREVVKQGWLLAAVQSDEAFSGNQQYMWDDQEAALRVVGAAYERLAREHRLDRDRLIVAGFSMGGETALRAALGGTLPASGFILLGPGGPTIFEPERWAPLIEEGAPRGLRGYILLGELEEGRLHEHLGTLVEMLNQADIPCGLEVIPGIGHDYPEDFPRYFGRALEFVDHATSGTGLAGKGDQDRRADTEV